MSWRASPSRPAPPVTSTSPDSLFVGTTSSRSHNRPNPRPSQSNGSSSSSSSSSTSAVSLLTRQKAEMDDDRRSLRSTSSSWTLGGNGSSSAGRQKSRSVSGASVRTVASSKTVKNERPSRGNSQDSSSTSSSIKGKGKQKEEEGEDSSETVRERKTIGRTHVDKRPKLVQNASSSSANTSSSTPSTEMPRKASWLWRSAPSSSSATTDSNDHSSATNSEPQPIATSELSSETPGNSYLSTSSTSSSNSQVYHTPDPSPRKPSTKASPDSQAMPPPPVPKRGWFGTVKAAPSTSASNNESDSSSVRSVTREDGTIKASSASSVAGSSSSDNDQLRTPKPNRLPLPLGAPTPQSGASRRASWWWGGEAEPDGQSASSTNVIEPEETSARPHGNNGDAATSDVSKQEDTNTAPRPPAIVTNNEGKSWLRTIWGETGQANTTEPPLNNAIDNQTPLSPALSSSSTSDASSLPRPISVPIQGLKSKASWFGRAASGQTPPTAASSLNLPPAIARAGTGLSSAAASTRSSTTTGDNSSPSSPYLGPQSDTVKPLTGSLRGASSPRVEPLDPHPPAFENLVLPTFRDTFERLPRCRKPEKSKLTKAVSVVSAYFFQQPPQLERVLSSGSGSGTMPSDRPVRDDPAAKLPKSLEIMEEPSRLNKIKRIVTIGLHGWFPNPRLKSVFGEPTGTSVKFATMMHDAIHNYLVDHDISSFNIQAIALEGQGEVDARVDKHFGQIVAREEWVDALKKADAVFIATHSQGTVVSTQLLARLLDQGMIVGNKTHMLAMCGIAQGPFIYLYQSYALTPYFNYLESAPARELFEYQSPDSVHTIKFLESLRIILAHGIKITTIGSINDQVVPLYSALFSGISHPGIIRAVYIDSQAFRTSDFLANLVVFAARLKNAGLHDHDLVYHVSEALAGALSGVGHSKIYEEEEVFTLAVRYHFETTSLNEPPTSLDISLNAIENAPKLAMSFNPRDRRNPYLLTWALRGIIEDVKVRELFGNELNALREAFETWRPATKTLKEVKLKLEGIRMLPRNIGGGKL